MFKPVAIIAVFLALAAGLAISQDQPQERARLYSMGKKAFIGCAACHFVTDPAIPEDADWHKLNEVTACINAGNLTAETRKAINLFLESPETQRPLRVDENYKPAEGVACGRIKVPATAGSAFLKAERDSIRNGTPAQIRLSWKATPAGQMFAIPAGDYKVIGYRFYAPDADKGAKEAKTWTLSVTDVNGCADLHITRDQAADFNLRPVLNGTLTAETNETGLKLKFAVRNEHDNVLTLSRDGVVCLPEFVILDGNEKELYRGAFENT